MGDQQLYVFLIYFRFNLYLISFYSSNLVVVVVVVVEEAKIFRLGGLIVCARNSESSALDSSPGRGHCAVLLGKTRDSHSASLHPGV